MHKNFLYSFFINLHIYSCFVPSVCICSYFVFFEMCQTVLTSSVHFLSYNFRAVGQICDFLPIALCIQRTVYPVTNCFEGQFLSEKKTIFLSAVIQQLPICLVDVTRVHIHMSENMCGIQNTVNGDNIVELILDPDSDGVVSN